MQSLQFFAAKWNASEADLAFFSISLSAFLSATFPTDYSDCFYQRHFNETTPTSGSGWLQGEHEAQMGMALKKVASLGCIVLLDHLTPFAFNLFVFYILV